MAELSAGPADRTVVDTGATRVPGAPGVVGRFVREVGTETIAGLRGRDLSLYAAAITFFGAIALVPALLVGLRLTVPVFGADGVIDRVVQAAESLPDGGHGVAPGLRALAEAAVGMSWMSLLVVLFPASLYGEGLRRGFIQVAPPAPQADTFTAWRGRLGFLPVVIVMPALVATLLACAPVVAPRYAAGGWSVVLGVVISFHVVFVAISCVVFLVYLVPGIGGLDARAALVGALCTGAVLAGFLHGFLLFLAIPLPWGAPFAGLDAVGTPVALVLWLYLLHLLLIVGYRFTLVLHERATS